MSFVVDASVAICWAMPDEADPRADAALARATHEQAITPGIWWYEVRNILVQCERRGRIGATETEDLLARLQTLAAISATTPSSLETLLLARRHRLTVYDAAYLALAVEERAPLATLDRALEAAARAEGVKIVE